MYGGKSATHPVFAPGIGPSSKNDNGAIATGWGVARVPESYLVAPNGVVVIKITGGVTDRFLEQQIAELESRSR